MSLATDPSLAYSTFLSGSENTYITSIAVDGQGRAYVSGVVTAMDIPGTFDPSDTFGPGGKGQAFLARLNADGSAIDFITYFGGSAFDEGQSIAVDAQGMIYVAGITTSSDFPTTPDAPQAKSGGGLDSFVVRFDPSVKQFVYSTYLGGRGTDLALGLAVDPGGGAYVVGLTLSNDFPATPGAFQTSSQGGRGDAFVVKVDPSGSRFDFATYLGGSGYDQAVDVAVDRTGYAYVTGLTRSSDFPTTPGAMQTTSHGGNGDAFVTRLSPTGAQLDYSTYLGGSEFEQGNGIAVDAEGNAYVTGTTSSRDFPTTAGAPQPTLQGYRNVFVTEIDSSGRQVGYSTYLGGNRFDIANRIAVDAEGNATLTGIAMSPNFPTTSGIIQTTFGGGGGDGFIARINPTGTQLVLSTFLGGRSLDQGNGIALDGRGGVYVAGFTLSQDFPVTPGGINPFTRRKTNGYVLKLNFPG